MLIVPPRRSVRRVCALLLCVPLCVGLAASRGARAQQPRTNVRDGQRYPRLVIRNATVVDGNGTPAAGPKDIVIEGDKIVDVVSLDAVNVQ